MDYTNFEPSLRILGYFYVSVLNDNLVLTQELNIMLTNKKVSLVGHNGSVLSSSHFLPDPDNMHDQC
jgi:hypothetical protein